MFFAGGELTYAYNYVDNFDTYSTGSALNGQGSLTANNSNLVAEDSAGMGFAPVSSPNAAFKNSSLQAVLSSVGISGYSSFRMTWDAYKASGNQNDSGHWPGGLTTSPTDSITQPGTGFASGSGGTVYASNWTICGYDNLDSIASIANGWHTYQIDYDGTNIDLSIDGLVEFSLACPGLTATLYPTWSGQNITLAVDDFEIYTDGDIPPPPSTESRIDTLTAATSTGMYTVTGYWNVGTNTVETLYVEQYSSVYGTQSLDEYFATTSGPFSFTNNYIGFGGTPTGTTTPTISAPITITADLTRKRTDCSIFPIEGETVCSSLETRLLDTESFTIAVSSLDYQINNPLDLAEYPEYECSFTSLTGCIKNAGIWLFYPTQSSLQQFDSLTLADRSPFAYAYDIGTLRTELFDSTQTASSTIGAEFPWFGGTTKEWTFLSAAMLSAVPFSSTIRLFVGWILILFMAEHIYRKILTSHNPATP